MNVWIHCCAAGLNVNRVSRLPVTLRSVDLELLDRSAAVPQRTHGDRAGHLGRLAVADPLDLRVPDPEVEVEVVAHGGPGSRRRRMRMTTGKQDHDREVAHGPNLRARRGRDHVPEVPIYDHDFWHMDRAAPRARLRAMPIARTMQWMGYVLWPLAGILGVIGAPDPTPITWFVAFGVLGVAFHLCARSHQRNHRLGAIVVMTRGVIRDGARAAVSLRRTRRSCSSRRKRRSCCRSARPRCGPIVQTLVVALCIVPLLGLLGLAEIIALAGFQAFAIATIAATAPARRCDARARAHADRARPPRRARPRSHRARACSSRSRRTSSPRRRAAHTARARELTDHLLRDVRAVVAAMRSDDPAR